MPWYLCFRDMKRLTKTILYCVCECNFVPINCFIIDVLFNCNVNEYAKYECRNFTGISMVKRNKQSKKFLSSDVVDRIPRFA